MSWITFKGILLNTNSISYFSVIQDNNDNYSLAAYTFDHVPIVVENYGKSESMARARLTIIKDHLTKGTNNAR